MDRLVLGDELQTIFLNTEGKNEDEVEPGLVSFLRFVKNTTQERAEESEDERIRRMYRKIAQLKNRAELEEEYMKMEERDRMIERRGEKRGEQNVIRSIAVRELKKGTSVERIIEDLREIAEGLAIDESDIRRIIAELIEKNTNCES